MGRLVLEVLDFWEQPAHAPRETRAIDVDQRYPLFLCIRRFVTRMNEPTRGRSCEVDIVLEHSLSRRRRSPDADGVGARAVGERRFLPNVTRGEIGSPGGLLE